MKNYKYLLFLLLITWIADAKTTRRRYPLDNGVEQKYTDSLALATSSVSWTPSSYFPGDAGYSNIVVNIPPQNKEHVKDIDYAASKSLADSKSAEEYVNKALQIQLQHNPSSGASSSSYTNYQGPSGKKTQHSYVYKTQTDAPRFNKIDQTPKPSSNFQMQQELISYQKPQQVVYDQGVHQTKQKEQFHQNSYNKQPEVYTKHYTENYQSPAHSDSGYQSHSNAEQVIKIIASPNYTLKKENVYEHSQNLNSQSGQLPTEYVKQIHDSVYKFMKEYNQNENEDQIHYVIKSTKKQQQNPHQYESLPQAQHQHQHNHHQYSHKIKHHDTYSHNSESIPTTQLPRFESHRKQPNQHKATENNYGQTSSHQRKPKAYPRGKAIENTQHTYTANVDLTGKSPKPVDLAALDVGQSWSHDSNFDHATALKSVQGFDESHALHHNTHVHKEPYHEHTLIKYPEPERLHFNEQTYHDINALSHTGVKYHPDPEYHHGYSHAEPLAYYSGKKEYSVSLPSSHTLVKHGGSANVGASISVGHKPSDFTYKHEELKSVTDDSGGIQIINGIPVANPYKIDVNTLRLMMGAVRAESFKHEETNHDHFNYYNVPYQHASEDLPFDSYNPKYNNNPSGEGYQEHHYQSHNDLNEHEPNHWEPSGFYRHHGNDLFGSATNNRPVKETPKRGKRGGGGSNNANNSNNNSGSKTKITIIKSRAKSMTGKVHDLSTELKPPPIQKKPSP